MVVTAKTFEELSAKEIYEILKSRAEIFIMEQEILYQDMDDVDYKALHCFIIDQDRVIAYLRAFYEDDKKDTLKIGRVLTLNHGQGVGKTLMEQSMVYIKERMSCDKIVMDAQTHAIDFYKKFGFQVVSEEFLEEGVMHVKMELEL